MAKYRVLHFPGEMTRGGVESLLMSWYRGIDRETIQFDFCVPRFERGPLDDEIESLGGRILRSHNIREKGVLSYISEVCSIIANNGPYDAVHIHGVHSGVFSLIAAKKAGIPKRIYHSHSTQNLAFRNLRFRKVIEWLCSFGINKLATVRLACSTPAGEFVFGNKSFSLIRNGIDLNRFYPYETDQRRALRNELGFPDNSMVIGNVARFVDGKNQQLIAQMIDLLNQQGHNAYGLFVGEGPRKEELERWCINYGIDNKIIFTGFRNDTENLYNCMDVFCLPSDFEGLGIVAIEAQACGIPCVVSSYVPTEANMHCVPFEAINLTEPLEHWAMASERLAQKRLDDSSIIKSINENGYSLASSVETLVNIYLN